MNPKQKIPVRQAIEILEQNLNEIDRVGEWAEAMGYSSPKKFSRLFRNHSRRRPKKVMIETKTQKAIRLLSDKNKLSNYEIAREIGKRDEQALFHFLKRETGKPPKFFREKNKSKNT